MTTFLHLAQDMAEAECTEVEEFVGGSDIAELEGARALFGIYVSLRTYR